MMETNNKIKELAEKYAEQSGHTKGRQDLSDGFFDGYNQAIKDRIDSNDKLYSEIEEIVIRWNINAHQTAGYLTREIIKILNK